MRGRKRKPIEPPRKPDGINGKAVIRFDVNELKKLSTAQTAALLVGIGKVVAANSKARS